MTYRTAVLGFGAFFTVVGFICLLVAVCTDQWLIIQVDSSSLPSDPTSLAFFTRSRGLFKECYGDNADAKPYVRSSEFADEFNECIRNDYMLPRRSGVVYSTNYRLRVDLMTSMVVFFCLAFLLCVVGFGVFCYACSLVTFEDRTRNWKLSTKWSGILIFLAAFFNAGGMAFYHGAEYVETQLVTTNGPEVPYDFFFRGAQPTALKEATMRGYSWSYALSWLAVFFEVLAAIMLFVCGTCCGPQRPEKKQMYDFNTINSARSYGQRNLAYEYMEGKAPVVYEAQPQPQVFNEVSYHDHFRGRHFDPYSRERTQHIEAHPQYNIDDGGWRWQ